LFDLLASKDRAMGSVVLAKNGEVVYSRAIGYAQVTAEVKRPADTATKYRIGSITKTFTSAMIFQLIEDKKISLTTTLDKFYPQFPNSRTITIGHMLSHRSGLFSFTNDPDYTNWMTQPKTRNELLALMSKHPS